MKKTEKVNEILSFIDNYRLTHEEYWRLISELQCLQESADSIEDIETAKWFEMHKNLE